MMKRGTVSIGILDYCNNVILKEECIQIKKIDLSSWIERIRHIFVVANNLYVKNFPVQLLKVGYRLTSTLEDDEDIQMKDIHMAHSAGTVAKSTPSCGSFFELLINCTDHT